MTASQSKQPDTKKPKKNRHGSSEPADRHQAREGGGTGLATKNRHGSSEPVD
jgi:hypothetical protein